MKKVISMLAIFLLTIGMVSAVVPTTNTDVTWNGAGNLGINFVSGNDAVSSFTTGGNLISGEFHGVDYNDNPYTYSVDTTAVKMRSDVDNGFIQYVFTRTDSYTPMYGVSGQQSGTLIQTVGGVASFDWSSTSNYAALGNSNYGWQNDNQMTATGDHYINHYISNGVNGAGIVVDAVGTTQVTDMCDGMSGSSSYSFGKGCGCYTNANVNVVGNGLFDMTARSVGSIVTDFGITTDGFLNVHSVFGSGFQFNDFALIGN